MQRLLAGGRDGPQVLAELIKVAFDATAAGTARRGGAAPRGGPAEVAANLAPFRPILPERGVGDVTALRELTTAFVAGSVDPAQPWCAAHLHGPPLAVAAVADVVTSALNPSMDSWDQAPIASDIERAVSTELAALCFPRQPNPDALITSGGTESNLLGLLLARERLGAVTVVHGRNAHHSIARAAWLLGLPRPVAVACADERLDPAALADVLSGIDGPVLVCATAGTTDAGTIDPLDQIAELARQRGAGLHIDAAYGGPLLFSPALAPLLGGLDRADTVTVDLHKLGWQPIPAGLLISADTRSLAPLGISADYLNAADDLEAGMPDLLGRSLRTSRRADAFRIAVALRALGRRGIAELIERCCATAAEVADAVDAHPRLRLWHRPTLSTVLLRPVAADLLDDGGDALVAALRRRLLDAGTVVLGRARLRDADGGSALWLKLTLLNPTTTSADYLPLLEKIANTAESSS